MVVEEVDGVVGEVVAEVIEVVVDEVEEDQLESFPLWHLAHFNLKGLVVGEVEGEVVGMEEVVVDMEEEGMAEAVVGVEMAIPAAFVNRQPYEEISEMTTWPTQTIKCIQ